MPPSAGDFHWDSPVAANVCSADFIQEHKYPGLYRVHEGPTPEKKDILRGYLKAMGVGLSLTEDPLPAEFQRIAQATPDAVILWSQFNRVAIELLGPVEITGIEIHGAGVV